MIIEAGKKIKLLTEAKAQQSKGFRCKLEGWCDSGYGNKTHSALRVKAGRKFSYRREIKGEEHKANCHLCSHMAVTLSANSRHTTHRTHHVGLRLQHK